MEFHLPSDARATLSAPNANDDGGGGGRGAIRRVRTLHLRRAACLIFRARLFHERTEQENVFAEYSPFPSRPCDAMSVVFFFFIIVRSLLSMMGDRGGAKEVARSIRYTAIVLSLPASTVETERRTALLRGFLRTRSLHGININFFFPLGFMGSNTQYSLYS